MRTMRPGLPSEGVAPQSLDEQAQEKSVRFEVVLRGCKLLLVAGFVAMPFALWALSIGIILPFIVAIIAMGGTFVALSQLKNGKSYPASKTLVAAAMTTGICLALIEPGIVDFGFASILLGPVLASLIGSKGVQRTAWTVTVLAIVLITGIDAFAAHQWSDLLSSNHASAVSLTAALFYCVNAAIVGFAAHRISASHRKYENAQVDTFRQLIEHVQHAVIRLSADGVPLFISNTNEKLFGCKSYELRRSGLVDRMHVQDRPNYLKAISDANKGGIARTIELRMRKDMAGTGSVAPSFIWVEISISPVLGDGHQQGHHELIMLLRDITYRKVQEEKVQSAQRAAQEASDAKSKFLATIGHELRTPLNAIVGFSEMMTSEIAGKLDDAPREYAGIIHKSGLHLLEVVNMLLDMSRIEAGKFELQPEPFMPDELVGPCIGMVDPIARERDIRIIADQSKHLPTVIGDQRACRQIVINLLSNAVKFSKPGGQVKVSVKRQGADLNITVADDGIGMSREVLGRVGEPFFQANGGTSRTHEGAGLGLSIVKGLVDLHDGQLRIASEPGRGTTITVLLPLAGPKLKLAQTQIVAEIKAPSLVNIESTWDSRKSVAS